MKLKVGDKVKLINYFEPLLNGNIGIIIEVRKLGREYPYKIDFSSFWLPVRRDEIEKVAIKGQQILFSFME